MRNDVTSRDLQPPDTRGRPLAEILQEMLRHISEILHSEIRLGFITVREEVTERKTALVSLVVAHLLLAYSGAFVLLGLVYALSTVVPAWAAALIVGAVLGIIGFAVMKASVRKLVNPKAAFTSKT